jgi:hypothetical protein
VLARTHSAGGHLFVARLLSAAFVASCLLLWHAPAAAKAWLGLDAWYLNGTHFESTGSVHDAFVAPNFQVGAGGNRLLLRAEGLPAFGVTSSPSNPNLPSTTSVGFVDGSLLFAVDRRSRFWLGLGELAINQQTTLPPPTNPFTYETESSRVAGARYEALLRLPVVRNAFVVDFAAMPALHGTYFASNCKYCVPQQFSTPERGAMTDTTALFELDRSRSTWALGVRFINYSALYSDYHVFADRNVGMGLILRYTLMFLR